MREAEREAVARRFLERTPQGTAVEAIVFSSSLGLTRFTRNAVHQNLASSDVALRARVVRDGRTGVAETNDCSDSGLEAALSRATEIARIAPREESHAELAAHPRVAAPPQAYIERTAQATPAERAAVVAAVADDAERSALWSAGYVSTSAQGITIANSAGTLCSYDGTSATLNVKANAADSTGYAEYWGTDSGAIDGAATAGIASGKAVRGAHPIAVEPGPWTVILEPAAFGELLAYLSNHFSAQAVDEGSSFLADGLDRRCAGETFTLRDNFAHALHAGQPFDYEGAPRACVTLVDSGIARTYVTDATWARKLGRANTGHGLPAPNAEGPQPLHLEVAAGPKSVEQLIAETKRGLLVSRFWYIRPVDYRKTIVTGMTRDGTFLIEDGKVGGGVRNLRFNQSILEALGRAEFANAQVRTGGYAYSMVTPAVKLEKFTFSSVTDF